MGDISDYYINHQIEYNGLEDQKAKEAEERRKKDFPFNLTPEERRSKVQWRTADGDVMFLKDMKDSHLSNAIKYLKREVYSGKYKTESIKKIKVSIRILEEEKVYREILVLQTKNRQK